MFTVNMLYLCQFFYVSTRLIGIPAHQTRPTQILKHTTHFYHTLQNKKRIQATRSRFVLQIRRELIVQNASYLSSPDNFPQEIAVSLHTDLFHSFYSSSVNICISFYSILQVHTPFPICLVFSYANTPAAQKLLRSRTEFCGRSIPWIKIKFQKREC